MTADSSNFDCPMVNAFMDSMQDKFVQMVMNIAGYMNVLQCTLQVHLSIGHGYTRSSNMSTDPMLQPVGPPIVERNSMRGNRILRVNTSDFFNFVRAAFRELSNNLVSNGSINVSSATNIVADLRLGDGHHANMSMRLRPVVHIGLGRNGMSFEMDQSGFSDSDNESAVARPLRMRPLNAIEDDGPSTDNEIRLYPITRMGKDSFMNRFNNNGSPP